MTTRITIPGAHPPSLNELMRGKLRRRMRLSRGWSDLVWITAHQCSTPKAQVKRRVSLTIVLDKGQRGADPDAYWKATLDALKACGLIKDDSRQWVELAPLRYVRHPGHKGTIIQLEDIDPALDFSSDEMLSFEALTQSESPA